MLMCRSLCGDIEKQPSGWYRPERVVSFNMNFKFYRPQLEFIDVLEPSLRNNGEYIIAPANYRMRQNINNDLQFGFIQINLTNPNSYSGLPITP